MAVTLAELLAVPGLGGLRVVAGAGTAGALRRPVTWVATSELADPTPYLQGGEFVLLTGLGADLDAGAAAYVGRLVDAGVAALGFGVGVVHADVPPRLVEAADVAGLPLVEVDRPTPFIAVGKALAGLLAVERGERDRRRLEGMRALTGQLARGPDPTAALRRLADQVGGWAALLDGRARARTVCGRAARPDVAERLAARLGRPGPAPGSAGPVGSTGAPGPASAADADEHGRVTVLALGVPDRPQRSQRPQPSGYLAVGVGPGQELDHQLVAFAASLLTLDRERARDTRAGWRWARAAALCTRLGLPAPAPAGAVLGPLAGSGPVHALVVDVPPDAALDAALDALGVEDAVTAVPLGAATTLLIVPAGEVDDVLAALAGCSGALSDAVPADADPADLAAAVARARSLAALARGRVLRAGEAAPSLPDLLATLGPASVTAFADRVLGGVLAAPDADVLVGSLTAYLAAHGALAVAATRLGVHRHTLRARLRRLGTLLGRDLDDVSTRAELWVALTLRAGVDPSPGPAPGPGMR